MSAGAKPGKRPKTGETSAMGRWFDVVRRIDFITVLVHLALITAGAFLALYLSSLHERKKQNAREEVLLQQLQQSLAVDISNLNALADFRRQSLNEINAARRYCMGTQPWTDTISNLFLNISSTVRFFPHPGAFESFKSTGIDLIRNPDIRFGLFTVYEENFAVLAEQELAYITILSQSWLPLISDRMLIDSAASNLSPLDFGDLRKDTRVLNLLSVFSVYCGSILQVTRHSMVDGELVNRQIQYELERMDKGKRHDRAPVKTRVTLHGYPDAKVVTVAGTFNSWVTDADTFEKTIDGWALEMNLRPGWYMYRFVVDGTWVDDPDNPDQIMNEYGTRNAWLLVE